LERDRQPLNNCLDHHRQLKVIEFFGAPGVGKSYLAKNATPIIYSQPLEKYFHKITVVRLWRKFSLIFRHIKTSIECILWAKKLTRFSSDRRRRWKVIFNWVFINAVILDAARPQPSLIVLDQGIAQGLWSTLFGENMREPLDDLCKFTRLFLKRLPVSKWSILHLTVPQETIRVRLEERQGLSPIDRDFSKIDEAISAEILVKEVICSLSKSQDKPNVEIVNILNNSEQAVSDCRSVIINLL